MFQHSIDPVLLSIGGVQIRYYGLVFFFAFLSLYAYLRYLSGKHILSLDEEEIDSFLIYFILGVIIGSRLFTFLFWNTAAFLENPLRLLYIWRGGMSYHGGLLGGVLSGMWFLKQTSADALRVADYVSVPSLLFLGFGRIANFINAELPGTVTQHGWCVTYPNHDFIAGCRHPYQLYAAAKNVVLFFLFIPFLVSDTVKQGYIFLSTIIAYNAFRFFVDFYRAEPDVLVSLSLGQVFSLIFVIVSVYFFIKIYKR